MFKKGDKVLIKIKDQRNRHIGDELREYLNNNNTIWYIEDGGRGSEFYARSSGFEDGEEQTLTKEYYNIVPLPNLDLPEDIW